jgi:carbonic anhydrase
MGQLSGYLALQELLAGNRRYVEGNPRNPDRSAWHRENIAEQQRPSAVIVSCSDSRLAPAVVFDQGLGFIFSIRTAGHVVTEVGLGSVEYALEQLGTQLVMVLGHTDCGAVTLAMGGGGTEGHLTSVVEALSTLPAQVGEGLEDPVGAAVELNVHNVVEQISRESPVAERLIREGRLMVVGAVYDVVSGEVTVIDSPD